MRELGGECPDLGKRDHGSWYYYVELPPGPRGERRRPRKGGFLTKKKAEEAAQEIWDKAQDGIDVLSDETVEQYLLRWFSKRVDLKRSTWKTYNDHIHRVFIPHLGDIKMRDLRTRHIQEMFEQIWRDNEQHADNADAAGPPTALGNRPPSRARPNCGSAGTRPGRSFGRPVGSRGTSLAQACSSR
ncbi:N-terminal phage integrase SAM-like domain-containing protein [Streptomyces sp. NPDC002004]